MIRFEQLAACGLDDAAVARRVRKGWLHRVHRGVYAVGYPCETLHAQFMAAVLAAAMTRLSAIGPPARSPDSCGGTSE